MADYGITPQGFNVKSLRDIQDSIKNRLLQLRDPDSGETLQVDWDSDDPVIQIINAFCDELSALWQLSYQCYGQFNPQIASGASLAGLVQLNGLYRKKGTKAIVVLTFSGQENAVIPQGTKVSNSDGTIIWLTSEAATIPASGSVNVAAASQDNGKFSVDANTINTIVDSLNGVYGVINAAPSIPGTEDESDASLRLRRAKSVEVPSRGIAESLHSALAAIDGVKYVKIFTNRGLVTDSRGIPAKSVSCVVQGGDSVDIAKEIFRRASLACGFYGNTTVNVDTGMSGVIDVNFQRPVALPIYVKMMVSPIEGSAYPIDYQNQIKQNIIDYAEGGPSAIGITGGFDEFGFPPSENVTVSRLYTPINAVGGVNVDSLEISTDGVTYSANPIEVAWNQIAEFSESRITIIEAN